MTRTPVDHTWSNWGKALFRVDTAETCVIVSAAGEIDMHTSAGLQEALLAGFRSSACMVIDLAQVTFVDSSTLGVLISARRQAERSGGSVVLVQPPSIVRKLLTGTRLQQSFPAFDSVGEATAFLKSS
jgi:anti-sigma B factor antagonist